MNPEKSSEFTLTPGMDTQPASGVTTPDLTAKEKMKHDGSSVSENSKADDALGSDAQEECPDGKHLIPVVLALVSSVFLIALDMTILGTAIPKITDEFHGLDKVSWYGSAYFMTFGGFQPASGKFYKYFPLKSSFLTFIFVFMVGSLICAVSKDSTTFIVGRAIAGVGAAGVGTGAFTIIAFAAEPRIRPGLIGMIGAVYGLSSVVGPLLGGVFTDKVTWRWCFYLNLPVGGVAALLVFFFFKTPKQATTTKATWQEKVLQMDPLGVAFVMGGIISFILALENGGQKEPWGSSLVIGLLVGSILIWLAFGIWEYVNADRAMIEGRLLKLRYVWQPSLFQFFYAAGYFVLLYYLPIYFQSVGKKSAIASGVLNLPLVLALAVGSTLSGTIVMKTGYAAPSMVVGAVLATISAGLMYTFEIDTHVGKWIGYQLFYGAAIGIGFQIGITIAQANATPQDTSSITAIVFFFQTIGGAFSVSAAQSAFVNRIITTLASTAPDLRPDVVIGTGATQIRQVFSPTQVPHIIVAYMAGIKVALAIVVALTGFASLLAAFVPTKRLNAAALKSTGGAA